MIKFWQCCFIYVLVFTVSDFNKVQKNVWIWAFCCLRCFCLSLSVQNILWSWECSCFGDTGIYECEGVMNLKWSCGNSVCEECTSLCLINRVHLFVCVCVCVCVGGCVPDQFGTKLPSQPISDFTIQTFELGIDSAVLFIYLFHVFGCEKWRFAKDWISFDIQKHFFVNWGMTLYGLEHTYTFFLCQETESEGFKGWNIIWH